MIALFRIQEMSAGQILVDGIDTATVPLRILRSKLGIIPQDPVIFSASVRFNLDPFDEYTDGMIWDALTSVDMKVRKYVFLLFLSSSLLLLFLLLSLSLVLLIFVLFLQVLVLLIIF